MQPTVSKFISKFYKVHGPFHRVLDVGSLDVNGSVRETLWKEDNPPVETVCVDMREGKGVDFVLNGHDLTTIWPVPHFDLVTCCETLEHDDLPWITVENIKKVLQPGGWMLLTVPGFGFPLHEYPNDYWRFTMSALKVFFRGFEQTYFDEQRHAGYLGVFGYGRKPMVE